MNEQQELIVNFTPTGMVPTREMTPHVPLTVEEVVADVREACNLGITMVHLHARDAAGRPTSDAEVYGRMIEGIRSFAPDLVIVVSLSGRLTSDPEQRAAPLKLDGPLKPDMGSLTLSSMNFSKSASVNAPDTVAFLARRMQERGIKPELEAFDAGMLNYARYLQQKGLLTGRPYVNLLVGNIASAQPSLLHMGMLENDLPPDAVWSFAGIGTCQARVHAVAIAMGGGVRVGLEDNIYFDEHRRRLARNIELVERVHRLAGLCGRDVMRPAALRSLLDLPSRHERVGVA
jgi:3-keto-5-aminohexanoate cleavage enzyme